ncbi:acetyl-CoA synthetase-like protein [Mollisia scopiformis]|uniref:Acetyl-CoA synthetase-like protein n=1 Tax=Mollisia scopiformis TaxID=149040 RepID=A0A132B6W7_MOLSC|nr:acetyl-CoA synthetase-like protein [Mollisia scopiformis]KUJ07624.1 acetyl-CoA synthetase-like protein [Mollisia scopiformis]
MSSSNTIVPYGRRLVPVVIDEIAQNDPERVFASIPKTTDLSEGYVDVTYDAFSRAINRAATFLERTFGRSGSFETLAYLGPFDVRYYILACGASKVGYKLLLPSPRNSLEGQLNLFKSTECEALLTSEGYNLSPQLISESGLTPISIPSLATFLAKGEVPHYPFIKTYEEAKNDLFIVLHTSGSTGFPKPIVLKHGWPSAMDAFNELEPIDGYEHLWLKLRNRRTFVGLPPFHAAGVITALLAPLWFNMITVWQPSNRPLSAVLVDEVLDASNADMIYLAPSIIEDMVQSPASLQRLERLAVIGYGGAPLDPRVGDLLSKKTKIVNTNGSTEMGPLSYWDKAPEDWAYFHYNPADKGVEFRPVGDGAYEQVFVRHPSTDRYHSAWWTFPRLEEYSMNDLYTPHPTKANLWLYAGRADDVIVLSNGEKLNPTNMEVTLRQHPSVKGALVVGQSRFAPAAIMELKGDVARTLTGPQDKATFLEDEIWPLVVKANEAAPAHARLSLDRLIFSNAEKPFARAGKETVQRGATVKLYADEIEEIYTRSEESQDGAHLPKINVGEDSNILEVELGKLIQGVTKVTNLEREQDFFTTGIDSLHVMTVVRLLKKTLVGIPHEEISSRLMYSHPSLSRLAAALKIMAEDDEIANGDRDGSREAYMQLILAEFSSQLPKISPKLPETSQNLVVLLTGSTGSLGSYLLHSFLAFFGVLKVYCLNRSADAEDRQMKENAKKGLSFGWEDRVEFLYADISKPILGLGEHVYNNLKREVSVVIHNQWPVDFNLSLTSFIPHLQGVSNLIAFSSRSPRSPPIFFTSSIGTLGHWNQINPSSPLVPEIALKDPRIPLHQGYSESKWIAENLLDAARLKSGVSSAILRIGQITGPVNVGKKGVWNRNEWFPSLVASSKYLGMLPDGLPGQEDVGWVPVDIVAEIVVELVVGDCIGGESRPWTRYYHVCNAKEGNWGDLVGVVKEHLERKHRENIEVVAFKEWLRRLEDSAEGENIDIEKNPGVKLLDFYNAMRHDESGNVIMDVSETERRSEKIRELKPVSAEWVSLWMEQWDF